MLHADMPVTYSGCEVNFGLDSSLSPIGMRERLEAWSLKGMYSWPIPCAWA
jgi:hypothetical protein